MPSPSFNRGPDPVNGFLDDPVADTVAGDLQPLQERHAAC